MRSRTLSAEKTILKKDLTRFAPVWLGLIAYLVIWGASIVPKNHGGPWGSNFYEPIAPIFAPILAISVFGYLCDPRECCMIHSLPLRRERLFGIHVTAASVMFLAPLAVFCLVTRNWPIQGAMYRFLFTAAEFLLLFAIGVLCMMLTGRKIGAALLYIFIQAVPFIASYLLEYLYLPMLPGVSLDNDLVFFSPTLLVANYANFIEDAALTAADWVFLVVMLVISLLILGISLLLYRKRKLEHAGDLLAVSWLDPFFAFCSGITGASVMALFEFDLLLMVLLGAAIGYLSYWMLSKKSGRVFTPKILAGLACVLAVLAGSVLLTKSDPLNRVRYVPEPEDVAEAAFSQDYLFYEKFTTSDPAQIEQLEALHLDLADHFIAADDPSIPNDGETFHITYRLKSGTVIRREYRCRDEALLNRAAWYLSQPISLFGNAEPEFGSVIIYHNRESMYFDQRLVPELEEILLRECREGRMHDFDYKWDAEWMIAVADRTTDWHTEFPIPASAVDTIAWLEEHITAAK